MNPRPDFKKTSYSIHQSTTGDLLGKFDLDDSEIENLSSETPEGHFDSGAVAELVAAGITGTVYALLN